MILEDYAVLRVRDESPLLRHGWTGHDGSVTETTDSPK